MRWQCSVLQCALTHPPLGAAMPLMNKKVYDTEQKMAALRDGQVRLSVQCAGLQCVWGFAGRAAAAAAVGVVCMQSRRRCGTVRCVWGMAGPLDLGVDRGAWAAGGRVGQDCQPDAALQE